MKVSDVSVSRGGCVTDWDMQVSAESTNQPHQSSGMINTLKSMFVGPHHTQPAVHTPTPPTVTVDAPISGIGVVSQQPVRMEIVEPVQPLPLSYEEMQDPLYKAVEESHIDLHNPRFPDPHLSEHVSPVSPSLVEKVPVAVPLPVPIVFMPMIVEKDTTATNTATKSDKKYESLDSNIGPVM